MESQLAHEQQFVVCRLWREHLNHCPLVTHIEHVADAGLLHVATSSVQVVNIVDEQHPLFKIGYDGGEIIILDRCQSIAKVRFVRNKAKDIPCLCVD